MTKKTMILSTVEAREKSINKDEGD